MKVIVTQGNFSKLSKHLQSGDYEPATPVKREFPKIYRIGIILTEICNPHLMLEFGEWGN